MKKLLLFQVFTAILFSVTAQNYLSVVDTNKLWSTVNYSTFGPPNMWLTKYHKFSGDTIINSVLYKKLWFKSDSAFSAVWYNYYFMREDSTGKVFSYDTWNECLVYDFGANQGDTLNVCMADIGAVCTMVVDSVDLVTISSQLRKRMYLSDASWGWPYPFIWIEGIGSMSGLLIPGICITDNGFELLCFTENDTLKYSNTNPPFNTSCYYSTVGINELENNFSFSIFPNPSSGILRITNTGELRITGVEVYNVLGEKVGPPEAEQFVPQGGSKKEMEIDLTKVPKGIYFVKVTDEKGNYSVRKTILE